MITFLVVATLTAYDGDTLKDNGQRLRLVEIDAPEINDKARCPYEHDLGIKSRDFVRSRINAPGAKVLVIRTGRLDKYHRPLVRLIVNGHDVGEEVIAAGLAKHWPPRAEWCGN
ncbi:MAG: thermonuclease family protein [Micropepsaceae bacterium]